MRRQVDRQTDGEQIDRMRERERESNQRDHQTYLVCIQLCAPQNSGQARTKTRRTQTDRMETTSSR